MNTNQISTRIIYKGNWEVSVRKDFILNPCYSIGAKVLYIALRTYCAPDGGDTAFPSSSTLAAGLDISRDSVFKYAKELEAMGLLEREQSHLAKGEKSESENGRFSHTVYTLYPTENPNQSIKSSHPTTSHQEKSIESIPEPASGFSRSGKSPSREKAVAVNFVTNNSVPLVGEALPSKKEGASAPDAIPQKRVATKAHPDRKALTDAFVEAYRGTIGEGYVFHGSADADAADRLLKAGFSVDDVVRTAVKAWKHPELFNCKQAMTLRGLGGRWQEIRGELRGVNGNGGKRGFGFCQP